MRPGSTDTIVPSVMAAINMNVPRIRPLLGVFLSAANQTENVYKTQSLGEWCAAHHAPYTLSEAGGAIVARLWREKNLSIAILTPPVFFGRLSDTVILPMSTFSCTADHRLVYEGLTHRDYAVAEDLEPFLVKDLGDGQYRIRIPDNMPTVEQECVFLGGRNNFGHFITEALKR